MNKPNRSNVTTPPIPFVDYQRMFRVIKTVLDGVDAHTAHSCIFFSVAGAYLVEQLYNKPCQPVAGAAFYKLDDKEQTVLSFADLDQSHDSMSSIEGFHCWIQCEGFVIDFMAPIFLESLQARGFAGKLSRKMFQKPLASLARTPLLLERPGDACLIPNRELSRKVLSDFMRRSDTGDLARICQAWYSKPPKDILSRFAISDSDGNTTEMELSKLALTGVW